AVEADGARRSHVREIRPLRVHVIVDAENDDVVPAHQVDLRLVERIGVDDGHVVAIVPVGDLVRNDHVEAGSRRFLDDLHRHECRGRDAPHRRVGTTELERVAVRGIAPRHTEILLDAVDDLSRRHAGLQYGSPAGSCRTSTSGTSVLIHSAHAAIPGSSDTTRPRRMTPLRWPECTASRAYSTDSHSRTSPATIASMCGSIASEAWMGVLPGSSPTRCTRVAAS